MRMMPSTREPQTVPGLHGIALALASLLAGAVHAQVSGTTSSPASELPSASSASASGSGGAASSQRRSFYVEPRVAATTTFTDNTYLDDKRKQSDNITQLTTGVRAVSEGGRVRGYFDYSLNKLIYSQASERSQTQNLLSANGTAELVDNWAFLDLTASISRQAISAFGTQSVPGVSNPNSTEVSSLRLSPYVRGKTFNQLNYEARYSKYVSKSKSEQASDQDSSDLLMRLGSDPVVGRLSWSADLTRQDLDYSRGRDTQSERARAVLTYTVSPQLGMYLIGGRERNNFVSLEKESHSSSGLGVNWSPSERTRLSAEAENRFFGHTHRISAEYRTPRTSWKYTDSKDVSTNTGAGTFGTIGTLYDLYFSLFSSIQPDPILRAQMVMAFLQANGLSPNAPTNSGFLSSGPTVQRRQDLSFGLSGARDTLTVIAARTESTRLSAVVAPDDLALSPIVKQRTLSVNYSHRLTPQTSLNLLATHQRTAGDSSTLGSTLKSYNVSVTSRLGLKLTGTLGARRVVSDSALPYHENAVTGSINVQF